MLKTNIMKIAVIFSLIVTILVVAVPTLAWYGGLDYKDLDIGGASISFVNRYFESGNGKSTAQITDKYEIINGEEVWKPNQKNDGTDYSVEDFKDPAIDAAFEIKTPDQLYNLAWLQYMGYFNANDNEEDITQTHFYLSHDLDMTGYVLPPIGTTDNPFIGTFDGNGHKILNLAISDSRMNMDVSVKSTIPIQVSEEINENGDLSGTNVMGLFGVVGTINNAKPAVSENGTDAEAFIHDVKIDNIQVNNLKSNEALLGYAAGYVNGRLENIAVEGDANQLNSISGTNAFKCSDFTADNLSEYGLVGYAADKYKEIVKKTSVSVNQPVVSYNFGGPNGDGSDWGGSVDMERMYTRLVNIYKKADAQASNIKYKYIESSTIINNKKTGSVTQLVNQKDNSTFKAKSSDSTTVRYLYYDSGGTGGMYNFNTRSAISSINYQYMYLSGENIQTPKIIKTYTKMQDDLPAFYIYSGDNYLNTESIDIDVRPSDPLTEKDGTIFVTTDRTDYTKWISDDAGHIYTIVDGTKYYLNESNGNLNLIKENAATIWNYSNNAFTTNSGYTLTYSDNNWQLFSIELLQLASENTLFYITNGNNICLTLSGNSLSATQNAANAILWIKDEDNHIYTYVNGGKRYLNYSGGNAVIGDSNPTAWMCENNTISYINNGTTYYLDYNSENKWQLVTTVRYLIYTKINNTTYYVNHSNSGTNVNASTTQNENSRWLMDTDGYYYYLDNGVKRYLQYQQTGMFTKTNTLVANNTLINRVKMDGIFLKSDDNIYFYRNNNSWRGSSSQQSGNSFQTNTVSSDVSNNAYMKTYTINYNTVSKADGITSLNIIKTEKQSVPSGGNTFFPLVTPEDNDLVAKDKNTGYVISGGNYQGITSDVGIGDIRVSYYAFSNLENSTNIKNNYSSDISNQIEILTTSYKKGGSVVRIKDNYNQNNTNNSTGMRNYTKDNSTTPDNLDFKKYNEARKQLADIFQDNPSQIYGLHFMDALISKDNLVYADSVTINGEKYTNYQMPQDSIDFKLKEKGYIDFFAGTYFTNNNSFFSLHHIFRDSDNKIEYIKEIKKIYGKENDAKAEFVYLYRDGTYSGNYTAKPSDYIEMFDTTWITAPKTYNGITGVLTKALYYYEIPVNEGEYALGSVEGGTGAYLMYLDIGTSAIPISQTDVLENITQTTETYQHPLGVNLIEDKSVVNPDNEQDAVINDVAFAMPVGATSLTASRSGYTVNVSADPAPTAIYSGEGVTINSGGKTLTPAYTSKQELKTTKITDTSIEYEVGNREKETKRVITESCKIEKVTYSLSGSSQKETEKNNIRTTIIDDVSETNSNPTDYDEDGNIIDIFNTYNSCFDKFFTGHTLPPIMAYHLWTSNNAVVSAKTTPDTVVYIDKTTDSKSPVLKKYDLTALSSQSCKMYVDLFDNIQYYILNAATGSSAKPSYTEAEYQYQQTINDAQRKAKDEVDIASS